MKTIILLILMIIIPNIVLGEGGWEPSEEQKYILDTAKQAGDEIGWPETIQAIQFVESTCGINKYGPADDNFSNRYFGTAQMKISTARYVIKNIRKDDRKYSDNKIFIRLLLMDEWAIKLSADYFAYLLDKFRKYPDPWRYAVLAYNRGPGTVMKYGLDHDPYNYVDKVNTAITTIIRPYNIMYASN